MKINELKNIPFAALRFLSLAGLCLPAALGHGEETWQSPVFRQIWKPSAARGIAATCIPPMACAASPATSCGFISARGPASRSARMPNTSWLAVALAWRNSAAKDGELRTEFLDSDGKVIEPFSNENYVAVKSYGIAEPEGTRAKKPKSEWKNKQPVGTPKTKRQKNLE